MAQQKELTKEEIEQYKQQLDVALKKSYELVNNFNVYIGVYRSSYKAQTSRLTKEEYEMMQDPFKCYNVKSLSKFYDNLADDDNYVTKKGVVLNENNFAMAFHPMVWKILTFEERIAALRIAWKKVHGKDITEFCNHYTTTVVFVGDDYKGSLNIASMLAVDSWMLFKSICNAKNSLKFNYYFNKSMSKTYKYITDFESFEELQYLAPLEPKEEKVEEMSDYVKAVFFNQLERRRMRDNYRNADYLIYDHCEEIKELFPDFDNALQQEIDEINETDTLVTKELGFFQKEIDEAYLSLKVDMFNNDTIIEHNKLCEEYYKLDDRIKEIKKPALEQTKDLRARKKQLEQELEQAGDAIEIGMIEDEIAKINIKINKICKKLIKKHQKAELDELSAKRTEVYEKIQELKSHIIELEDAKQHFKEYFYGTNKKYDDYKSVDVSKPDTTKLSKEDYEKMN